MWELGGNVYHQGSRFEASAATVPFLARMVDDPSTPGRAGVLWLLRTIAIGDLDDTALPFAPDAHFAEADGITDDAVAAMAEWLYADEDERAAGWPDDIDALDVVWSRNAYLAAAEQSEGFVRWAADDDPEVVAVAAELLAWFPVTEAAVEALMSVPADESHSGA
ncbi:hypothetical protein ACFQ07_05590, partial [Actinomadura adrarensis]